MKSPENVSAYFAMPSFEPRSNAAIKEFITKGGSPKSVYALCLSKDINETNNAVNELKQLGVLQIPYIDRSSSRQLWQWVWSNVCSVEGRIIIDATSFTRELLGMLLFAASVRRDYLEQVTVHYVSTGSSGYITQHDHLPESERWLSRGIIAIRSIVGYPGDFYSERPHHVIAFAGHELDRLLDVIDYLEPSKLSISNEKSNSSTVRGASDVSLEVADKLRSRIPVPEMNPVDFSANSIEDTYQSLLTYIDSLHNQNIVLVPMNTKLSFIGAALAALQRRHVRIVYSVPEEYNIHYSSGIGQTSSFDITDIIKAANTIPVQTGQGE